MNSGTALAGVETKAGCGIGMIGNFCAPVQVNGSVRLSGGDNLDATGGEERTQPGVEGEICVLFELTTIEMSTGIVAPVGSVEYDDKAGWGRRWRLGSWGRGGRLLRDTEKSKRNKGEKHYRNP
jgi:hypothetical protein